MKVLTGRVVDGRIEVGDILQDGVPVAVISLEPGAPMLAAEDERDLAEALAEIRAGAFVDGEQLLVELRARARR